MKNFETLEVGKTYKNRLGELVEIIKKSIGDLYLFLGSDDRYYTCSGNCNYWQNIESNYDLIEMIENTPKLAPNGQDVKPFNIELIDAEIKRLQELRKELDKNIEVNDNSWGNIIGVRIFGKYEKKGFRLSSKYNWEMVNDCGDLVLIPTKK